MSSYLLPNGNLLSNTNQPQGRVFGSNGNTGLIQELRWDGTEAWRFELQTAKYQLHHDAIKLPNGNVLLVVWDRKTAKEAVAAGRRPEIAAGRRRELPSVSRPGGDDPYLLAGSLLEVRPTGKTTGEIVWEWHVWDHLVQDFDNSKANFGNVGDHPELVDVNYAEDVLGPIMANKDAADKLRSLGYVGSASNGKRSRLENPDWTHVNSVACHRGFDQIVMSVLGFNEVWVIDHSTTKAEAASHRGGRSGKGGDLLYRWGNPRAYRAGSKPDQQLFAQHNADWIPRGSPGEGHLLVFNNGRGRMKGDYSSVEEFVPRLDEKGRYSRRKGAAFGPDAPVWSYAAPNRSDFLSQVVSGAQRLPNGNTLICSGVSGILFEVTADKEIVWKYVTPVKGEPNPGIFGFPPSGSQAGGLFRASRYAPDYPGLAGKTLIPGKTIEELQAEEPGRK